MGREEAGTPNTSTLTRPGGTMDAASFSTQMLRGIRTSSCWHRVAGVGLMEPACGQLPCDCAFPNQGGGGNTHQALGHERRDLVHHLLRDL